MADAKQKPTPRQRAALNKKAQRELADLPDLIEEVAGVIGCASNVIQANTDERKREIERRAEMLELEYDVGVVCEMFARQSKYLARTIQRVEQRSGVALSPTDLLCGILNGIEESGLDLSYSGTREEVAEVVKSFLELAIEEVKKENRR